MLYQDSLKKLYSILEKITSKQKVELSTLDNIDFLSITLQKKILVIYQQI